jgi:hypothetical protein
VEADKEWLLQNVHPRLSSTLSSTLVIDEKEKERS